MFNARKIAKYFVDFYFYRNNYSLLVENIDNAFIKNIIKKWDPNSSTGEEFEEWSKEFLLKDFVPQIQFAFDMYYVPKDKSPEQLKRSKEKAEESKKVFEKFMKKYFEKSKQEWFDKASELIEDSYGKSHLNFDIGEPYFWKDD